MGRGQGDASGKWPGGVDYEQQALGPAELRVSLIRGLRGLVARVWAFTDMAEFESLLGELRFHKAHSQEKKKKAQNISFHAYWRFFTRKEGLENELAFCTIRQKEDEDNFDRPLQPLRCTFTAHKLFAVNRITGGGHSWG